MRGDYDVTYSSDKQTLILKANLDQGWRKLEKTYGFFRTMWVWYPGDFRVRTQLSALAQPATFHQSADHFPDVTLNHGNQQVSFRIEQKMLEVRVALNAEQPWRLMMGKRPGLFFDDLSIEIGQPHFWLDHIPPTEQGTNSRRAGLVSASFRPRRTVRVESQTSLRPRS